MQTVVESLLEACMHTMRMRSFSSAYARTFEVVKADSPELKRRVYNLRYRVYCEENGFEKPADTEMEFDEFDKRATHFLLIHKASGQDAGTVRLVPCAPDALLQSFPIQQHCDHPFLEIPERLCHIGEISRFCMAPEFRRRPEDTQLLSSYSMQDSADGHHEGMITFVRRKIAYAPAGLLRAVLEEALRQDIGDVLWMVEASHVPSLKAIGLPIHILGPRIDYHGGSQPLIFNIKTALDAMHAAQPYCWDIITDSGRLQDVADKLQLNRWQDRILDPVCREKILEKLAH
ncbi:MAG TPA: PEP-CTERM/exosortase system-associated acyltransferase [Alphaproteobacteria bacterium]|nr:PEP-CTERM/exosortase system-associated acyltransferase [Alphaproteobacteria bacterium]